MHCIHEKQPGFLEVRRSFIAFYTEKTNAIILKFSQIFWYFAQHTRTLVDLQDNFEVKPGFRNYIIDHVRFQSI